MPYSASSRTSTGGTTGSKPCSPSTLERPAHQRQLEQHERALEVGEARAGHARAGLQVDQVAEQLEVVAARRARLADLAQHRVLVGGRRVGEVRQRRRAASSSSSSTALQLGVELLLAVADRPATSAIASRRVLALALQLADLLAGRVLLGPQRLELGQQLAPARVELEHPVERAVGAVAAARERRPRRVGLGADRLEVEHAASLDAS